MGKIAVLGDIMIDEYHYGEGRGENPESGATILTVKKTVSNLGGAANVAATISSLVGEVLLLGTVGENEEQEIDMYGNVLIKLCQKAGITLSPIKTPEARTIVKSRFIKSKFSYHVFRGDFEDRISLEKPQKEQIIDALKIFSPEHIIISDYAKGTLDAELVHMIFALAKEMNIKLIVDTKPKNTAWYTGAYVIKPNFSEFTATIQNNDLPNEDDAVAREGKEYARHYDTNAVITRGEKGVSLIPQEGEVFHAHTQAKKLTDITGAGDTFIAAFTVALSRGKSLEEAVIYANKASGIAVGKPGTAVVTPQEME